MVFVGGHNVRQLVQRLLDGQGLGVLLDLALRGGAHHQLHPQRSSDQRLHPGQTSGLAQHVQVFQHEQGVHLGDILFHLGHHLSKGHAGRGQLGDFQSDEGLTSGGRAGVKHPDVALGVLLHKHLGGLPRAVVGAGEQSGEGDHINVSIHRLKGVQIVRRRGTGGVGGLLAHGHGIHQGLRYQGVIIPELVLTHIYGQGNTMENAGPEQFGAEVAAAIDNNFKTHKQKPLISFLQLNSSRPNL